jgi:hypothetical protein
LTSSSTQLDYYEIQDFFHRSLGHFFVAFASIELNLSLRVGGTGTFQDKLERFLDATNAQQSENDTQYCEQVAWYMAADSIREVRNRFAHGRWGVLVVSQSVVHVSGYPPAVHDERNYSLVELRSIVADAELLSVEVCKFNW